MMQAEAEGLTTWSSTMPVAIREHKPKLSEVPSLGGFRLEVRVPRVLADDL
jgi:hypothetical protein